jgi:hypothetical protein
MKNLNPEEGGEIFGGRTDRDLIKKVQLRIDRMFDDELEEAVVGLKKSIDAQNTELLMLIGEYDRRKTSSTEYELSTTSWLKFQCRRTATEASGTVKRSRALAEMPSVAEQANAGNVVPSAIKLLARTRDVHPEKFAEDEAMSTDISTYLNPGDLRRAVSYWVQQVDYPSALDDVESARRSRHFSFNKSYRGMWAATGDLDPESGHIISPAMHSLTDPSNLDCEDMRSAPQRSADALTDICRFFLDHNDSVAASGGEKPHITVTLDYRILSGKLERLPEIDGVAIDPEALRRLTATRGSSR